jgi:excisionase family DNA binding protein
MNPEPTRIELSGNIFEVKLQLLINNVLPMDRIEKSLLTAEQAAKYLQVHPDTLRRWVRRGHFPRTPLPGSKDFRFSKAQIDEWVTQRALGTNKK